MSCEIFAHRGCSLVNFLSRISASHSSIDFLLRKLAGAGEKANHAVHRSQPIFSRRRKLHPDARKSATEWINQSINQSTE